MSIGSKRFNNTKLFVCCFWILEHGQAWWLPNLHVIRIWLIEFWFFKEDIFRLDALCDTAVLEVSVLLGYWVHIAAWWVVYHLVGGLFVFVLRWSRPRYTFVFSRIQPLIWSNIRIKSFLSFILRYIIRNRAWLLYQLISWPHLSPAVLIWSILSARWPRFISVMLLASKGRLNWIWITWHRSLTICVWGRNFLAFKDVFVLFGFAVCLWSRIAIMILKTWLWLYLGDLLRHHARTMRHQSALNR